MLTVMLRRSSMLVAVGDVLGRPPGDRGVRLAMVVMCCWSSALWSCRTNVRDAEHSRVKSALPSGTTNWAADNFEFIFDISSSTNSKILLFLENKNSF